jgi:hypothetical protein
VFVLSNWMVAICVVVSRWCIFVGVTLVSWTILKLCESVSRLVCVQAVMLIVRLLSWNMVW